MDAISATSPSPRRNPPPFFAGGYPYTAGRFVGRLGLTALAAAARRKAVRRGLAAPQHFFGMLAGGDMRQQHLHAILDRLPDGVSEIMVHPGADDAALGAAYGWQYRWEAELAAVTSPAVKERLAARGVELVSFREISHA